MNIIDKFILNYQKEYDYYFELSQICADQCEAGLDSNGIRAIITFRAKKLDSPRETLIKRNKSKNFSSISDIPPLN